MTIRRPGTGFLWTDALDLLAEADRLHRQFFTATPSPGLVPNWQPPVDTLETADAVIVLVALPGVAPQNVEIVHHDGALTVRGMRPMPGDGVAVKNCRCKRSASASRSSASVQRKPVPGRLMVME